MLLAVLERAGLISPVYSYDGSPMMGVGTVAAGYQNFVICIEMFFAAVGLWFAFPHKPYIHNASAVNGRNVSLQSISSNLKETINPKDIMVDAIHNFHPNYQEYTQHGNNIPTEELECYREHESHKTPPRDKDNYQHQQLEVPRYHGTTAVAMETEQSGAKGGQSAVEAEVHPAVMPGLKHSRFTEKTNLLSPAED